MGVLKSMDILNSSKRKLLFSRPSWKKNHNKIWWISRKSFQETNRNAKESIHQVTACGRRVQGTASQLVVSILSVIACCIGCTIHIWYISDIYFKYEVTTSMSIGSFESFELPAITVCVGFLGTFNKIKWMQRFGSSEETKVNGRNLLYGLTIREINDLGGPNMERDRIISYMSINNEYNSEPVTHWRPSLKSLHIANDLKCETFFLTRKQHTNISYSPETYIVIQFRYIRDAYVSMIGRRSDPNIYRVYVHPSSEAGYRNFGSDGEDFIKMTPGRHAQVRLTPPSRTILLPFPYQTDCFNYSNRNQSGIANRAECLHNCRLTEFRKISKTEWPLGLPINLNDDRYNWSTLRIQSTRSTEHRHIADGFRECQRTNCARADCTQNYIGKTLLQDEIDSGNHSLLFIYLPTDPGRTYTSNRKMEFVEYLCYVAGVLSLWLGISGIGCITYVRNKFHKAYRQRRHNGVV